MHLVGVLQPALAGSSPLSAAECGGKPLGWATAEISAPSSTSLGLANIYALELSSAGLTSPWLQNHWHAVAVQLTTNLQTTDTSALGLCSA